MRYLVAQEIKSETKVSKNIYLFDFFFLIIYMTVSLVLGTLVQESLKLPFYLYSFFIGSLLTGKSYFNRKRRNYESIAIMIRKDTQIYYPVINVSKKSKHEEKAEEDELEIW